MIPKISNPWKRFAVILIITNLIVLGPFLFASDVLVYCVRDLKLPKETLYYSFMTISGAWLLFGGIWIPRKLSKLMSK